MKRGLGMSGKEMGDGWQDDFTAGGWCVCSTIVRAGLLCLLGGAAVRILLPPAAAAGGAPTSDGACICENVPVGGSRRGGGHMGTDRQTDRQTDGSRSH